MFLLTSEETPLASGVISMEEGLELSKLTSNQRDTKCYKYIICLKLRMLHLCLVLGRCLEIFSLASSPVDLDEKRH